MLLALEPSCLQLLPWNIFYGQLDLEDEERKHNTAGYRREDGERKAQHWRVSASRRGKKLNTAGPQLGSPRNMIISIPNIIQYETSKRQHLYAQLDREDEEREAQHRRVPAKASTTQYL